MKFTLLLSIAFLTTAALATTPIDGSAVKSSILRQGPPAEKLAELISAKNKFPVVVENFSQLDSVTGKDDTLTYNYSILKMPDTIEGQRTISEKLREKVKASACSDPNFVVLIEGGYTLVLNYSFGNPAIDVHVRLDPRKCK